MSLFNVNQVTLLGNTVRQEEVKYTNSGTAVINFTVVTNFSKKTDDGYEDVPTFHSVIAWGKMAEAVANFPKGSKVFVQGRIEKRSYENKEGQTVNLTEVVADRVIGLDRKQSQSVSDQVADETPF
jgi:single-strand DNA-binding protein